MHKERATRRQFEGGKTHGSAGANVSGVGLGFEVSPSVSHQGVESGVEGNVDPNSSEDEEESVSHLR